MLAELFLPQGGAAERRQFADFQRAAATPSTAADLLDLVYRMDVRHHLPEVAAPTLVVHRRGDRAVQFPLGIEVASRIAGARFVPLDGHDHLAWEGDQRGLVEAILAFLGRGDAGRRAGRTPTATATSSARASARSCAWSRAA